MSTGLGRIERAILSEIRGHEGIVGERHQRVTRAMVAAAIFNTGPFDRPTRAQLGSISRGFRSLIRKGLVEEIDWPNAVWTTEEGRKVLSDH